MACLKDQCWILYLFLIYINDLPNLSKYLSFYLFADDTDIYFKSHDLAHLQKIMNRELKKVRKWLDANRLSLNIDKTNFVVFHSPHKKIDDPVVIRFGRKKIKRENCVKFLGILLDANLSWKYHVNELSKKTFQNNRNLLQNSTFCSSGNFENFVLLFILLFCFIWYICVGIHTQILCPKNLSDSNKNYQGHDFF